MRRQFTVPQFIERETRILGSITFKQGGFILGTCAIIIFLYFSLKSFFFIFLILAILTAMIGLSLAFLKPGGLNLTIVIANLFAFLFRPKIYLWQKKPLPPKILKKEIKPEKEIKQKSVLRVTEKSYLTDLSIHLETKLK